MEKMAWDGPKWGREDFFPTNPGLANILGRMDLDFEDFYFFHLLDPKFLDFQVPRFPKSGLGLGRAWAGWTHDIYQGITSTSSLVTSRVLTRGPRIYSDIKPCT